MLQRFLQNRILTTYALIFLDEYSNQTRAELDRMGTSMEAKPGIRIVRPRLLLLSWAEESFSKLTRVTALGRGYKPTMSTRAATE